MTISIAADTIFCRNPHAGYPFRIMNFAKACRRTGSRVQIFLCNRNFTRRKDITWLKKFDSEIKFFLVPPDLFYKRSFFSNFLSRYSSEIVQFENPEFAVNNSQVIIKNQGKSIFILELHNLYYRLNQNIGEFQILKAALHLVDYVMCFSQFDCDKIVQDFKLSRQKIILSPLFVDCHDYKVYRPNLDKDNVLFIGNFFYKPNAEAANFLIKDVYPRLRKNFPALHLHFVGNYPVKLFQKSPHWTFHGYAMGQKLDSILKETKICTAPLFSGYGARVKVLEYAAYGFPIIATSVAMAGLEKLTGVFIAPRRDFAAQLAKYLRQNKSLARNGFKNRKAVEKYYKAKEIMPKLITQIVRHAQSKSKVNSATSLQPTKTYLPSWLKEKRHNSKVLKSIYVIERGKIKKISK